MNGALGVRIVSGLLAVVATAVACGDNNGAAPMAASLSSGSATLALSADGTSLVLANGAQTLLTFGTDAFQVGTVDDLAAGDSFDPYWLFVDSPPAMPGGLTWNQLPTGHFMKVVATTATALTLELDYNGVTAQVAFTADAANSFVATMTATVTTPQSAAYFRLRPNASATEGFYGLGEWADSVDHRGKLRPMQMEYEADLENSDDENHVPVPLLIGTNGWGLFVESRRPGVFDVARATPTIVDVTFGTGVDSGAGLKFHLFAEPQPLDIFKHYYDVTGYPGIPAPWATGPLLWRDENANQAQVIDDISQIRTRHLATSGMWFDRPYATGVETFDFSAAKFSDPATMLQALHDGGFRYGVWQSPYTGSAGNSDPAPTQLAYATSNDYFPPTTGVLLNDWGKPIDFTNPAAYAWWQGNLKAYTDPLGAGGFGVEGFKLDYAEDIVVGLDGQRTPWAFADGTDEGTEHYTYTMLYHQIHRELLDPKGAFLLDRAGRWGDQVRGAIIWPGDLDCSMAQQGDPLVGDTLLAVGGVPAAVTKGIGLSASGFPFYASDTGGYKHSPPNNETWTRWAEANAVTDAMIVGDASSQMPWEFTPANGRTQDSVDTYQKYASLHMRLYPYSWTYAQQIATTGRPIMRPVGLAYPALGMHPHDEYLFGDSILAAPVVVAGATSRSVLLPPGTWLGWWDGQPYTGTITAAADLDTLPLYIQQGGIVPMLRDTIDTLAPVPAASTIDSFANDPGVLWARIAPGPGSNSFTLYDGSFITQGVGTSFALGFVAGSVFTQGAMFEVIATAQPTTVTTVSAPLTLRASLADLEAATDGWFWEAATGGTLWIKIAGTANVSVQ